MPYQFGKSVAVRVGMEPARLIPGACFPEPANIFVELRLAARSGIGGTMPRNRMSPENSSG